MALPLLRHPSALAPLGLALGALTLPWIALAVFGPNPTGDEGAAARLFQLLMAAQIPCILFFLAKWGPREPRQAMIVLALQVVAFLVPLTLVLALEAARQ